VTRAQLGAVAALSLVSTGIVLADAADTTSTAAVREALARAGAARRVAAPVAASAAAPAAPVPASAGSGALTAGSVVPPSPAASAPAVSPASAGTAKTPAKASPAPATAATPAKVRHVFLIALTGTGADATFGPGSVAPYLAQLLRPQGTLLDNYVPLDRSDLTNELALIGGQPPNADTTAECPTFQDFPANARPGKSGVVSGAGCVYPNTVLSLGDQLTASRRSWRAYLEDMGNGPAGAQSCRHPDDGAADDTLQGRPGDQYATRHNPFVYFHSLLDLGDCQADDVTLDELTTDLQSVRTTPSLSFIAPNLCDAGTEQPCVDGRAGGLPAVDAFLRAWVPQILESPAYRQDGLLMITFLSSATTGTAAATQPAGAAPPRTGVLLLSRYAKRGATIDTPYDPYALLHSIEDVFALEPLAKSAGAASFARLALPAAFGH
jgi:hypothetical protein